MYADRPHYDEELGERIAEVRHADGGDAAAVTVPIEEVIAERLGLSVEEAHAYWAEQIADASR